MLVGAHDSRVNHGVCVVRILGKSVKDALPDTCLAPARMARMHYAKVPKGLRQVPLGDAGAVAVQHGIDEQTVVACGRSGLTCLAGQEVFDAFPVAIGKCVSLGHAHSYER